MLSAQNISCIKQDRTLFAELDLTLNSGELIHLVGPNGAGKTSLLRILVGLSEPETGQVTHAKANLQSADRALPILYLGHKLALNKYLSALENLQYWLYLHGEYANPELLDNTTMMEYLYTVLTQFRLVGLEDIPVGQLSAGQQRRVSLARTQLVSASVWILDEPYTSLDTNGVTLIQNVIDDFVTQQGAVLMTSHQALQSRHNVTEFTLEYQI